MPFLERIPELSAATLARFDAVIDVRSPAEFADDHLPGAINLPVLSDAERVAVGTIYKQESAFLASRMGAAIVARNIAAHLDGALSDHPRGWRPLIYCWRGGMRSNAMATILAAVGWPVGVVDGGHKTWRREVVGGLDGAAPLFPVVLIDGQTGSGKTALLGELAARGGQVIDLEGFACHRGSAFGAFDGMAQPAQRLFESALWQRLRGFDLSRPIYVEAESARIGLRRVPRRLWASMRAAPRIVLIAPAHARARFLVSAYGDAAIDPARVTQALSHLKGQYADERLLAWQALATSGDTAGFAEALVTGHYDAGYARSRRNLAETVALEISLNAVTPAALGAAADVILAQERGAGFVRAEDSTPPPARQPVSDQSG
jgi:tRNA 2-selenouridine synthase